MNVPSFSVSLCTMMERLGQCVSCNIWDHASMLWTPTLSVYQLDLLIDFWLIHWLIDWLIYVPLKNISHIWRRYHYRWRTAKFRPMLGAQGLWAEGILSCLTSVSPVSSEGPPYSVASYDTQVDVEDLFLPGLIYSSIKLFWSSSIILRFLDTFSKSSKVAIPGEWNASISSSKS
jgi:hypothetical protein